MPDNVVNEDDYGNHVRTLAERLREANKVASQQSKLSHKTAKRYYDRQTKLSKFKIGDLVYVHDPTYKRGKAKKFSYQYKGPFEIVHRISPLIYKVKLTDGTCIVVHINRLKKAYSQERNNESIVARKQKIQVSSTPREKCTSLEEIYDLDTAAPSRTRMIESDDDTGGQISNTFECLNSSYAIGYPLRNGCHAAARSNDVSLINHFELQEVVEQKKSFIRLKC